MTENGPSSLDGCLQPLLESLNTLLAIQRHLNPVFLNQLKEKATVRAAPLQEGREALAALDVTDDLKSVLDTSFELAEMAIAAFGAIPDEPEGIFMAYRAIRYVPYAMEMLYPAVRESLKASRYFLEEDTQEARHERLLSASPREDTGVLHFNNEREEKGGCSIYVPEDYYPDRAYPVVVAHHGGSGHGRAFLWTWLKEARSREFILISPTARGDTWSIMQPDVDGQNIEAILEATKQRWNIDSDRLLMTGMSDGGTFTFMSGLGASSPFTHLAPIAASFHVMMMEVIGPANIKDRPIYLTHGLHDWMFDVAIARVARDVLAEAGAEVIYREIPDLAHNYPRDENAKILDWFLG